MDALLIIIGTYVSSASGFSSAFVNGIFRIASGFTDVVTAIDAMSSPATDAEIMNASELLFYIICQQFLQWVIPASLTYN